MWQGRLSGRRRMHGSKQSQMRHRKSTLVGRLSANAFRICRELAEACYHWLWLQLVLKLTSHAVLQLHNSNTEEGISPRFLMLGASINKLKRRRWGSDRWMRIQGKLRLQPSWQKLCGSLRMGGHKQVKIFYQKCYWWDAEMRISWGRLWIWLKPPGKRK